MLMAFKKLADVLQCPLFRSRDANNSTNREWAKAHALCSQGKSDLCVQRADWTSDQCHCLCRSSQQRGTTSSYTWRVRSVEAKRLSPAAALVPLVLLSSLCARCFGVEAGCFLSLTSRNFCFCLVPEIPYFTEAHWREGTPLMVLLLRYIPEIRHEHEHDALQFVLLPHGRHITSCASTQSIWTHSAALGRHWPLLFLSSLPHL